MLILRYQNLINFNYLIISEKLGNVIIDQTIDLKRLYNNEEVRSVRSRKNTERDKKILQAQLDLISERCNCTYFLICILFYNLKN